MDTEKYLSTLRALTEHITHEYRQTITDGIALHGPAYKWSNRAEALAREFKRLDNALTNGQPLPTDWHANPPLPQAADETP
ncbi:hypothetical protein ACIBCN_18695 [Nocardia sp. NPDC051052]|uniref:hypothetical protein n=1 Tax=Nocardia sp. NPDC051052 TaxID=3364322 RepID=UPI0037AEE6C6